MRIYLIEQRAKGVPYRSRDVAGVTSYFIRRLSRGMMFRNTIKKGR